MRHRARVDDWIINRIGVTILALALLSVGILAWTSYDNRTKTGCQVEYNQAVSTAIRERSKYADEDRKNLVEFIRKISLAKTREASRDALNEYLQRQDDISRARTQHPVPSLPPGECS